MGKLDVKKQEKGSKVSLQLSGAIDEDAKLPDLAEFQRSAEIEVDMGGTQTVNSCGVREWVKWVKAIPSTLKLTYVNSPKIIVDQMNMISGLLPNGCEVKSFYVPYFCEHDKLSHAVLFTEGKEFQGDKINTPEVHCPKCNRVMEIDVIEAKYFKFLSTIS